MGFDQSIANIGTHGTNGTDRSYANGSHADPTQANITLADLLGPGSVANEIPINTTVLRSDQVVTIKCRAVHSDADGTVYDTEDGLYADADACYARVIKDELKHHERFAEICSDDEQWRQFWSSAHKLSESDPEGRTFQSCLKRGLDGDVLQLSEFLEQYFGGMRGHVGPKLMEHFERGAADTFHHEVQSEAEAYGQFRIVPSLFRERVVRLQSNDSVFSEMLSRCRKIPYYDELIVGARRLRLGFTICSAAPHENTIRATQYFRIEDKPGIPPEFVGKSIFELCDLVTGDVEKVRRTDGGRDEWSIDGIRKVARELEGEIGDQASRRSTVMVGDTMSDVGASILNGIGMVIVRVPEGPGRERELLNFARKIKQLCLTQGDLIRSRLQKSGVVTEVIFVNCWSQVKFTERGSGSEVATRDIK